MPNLNRAEAVVRAGLLSDLSYEVDLDLTGGPERFRSATTIRFRAQRSASTFVELRPAVLRRATLNGAELDPTSLADNRLPLPELAETNVLVVEADMRYSRSAEGLHRFVDPADEAVYLYAMAFLDNAQRIFACFDQPDLKAPVTMTVTAPDDWTVAANGALAGREGGRWRFTPTHPLSTYVVTLIAGPYEARRTEHDGVPMALYARRSQAAALDRDLDELFDITRRCLDRFHGLFDYRYPFGQYDQAFVPEFNAGAMENPGLVTLRDEYLYESAATMTELERRAEVMAHEMAHMWFGDLVTMRWWDDLWLNESFAQYLGVRVATEATRYRAGWVRCAIDSKRRGYAADQRPSTHPVAPGRVDDTEDALTNFDGISYDKGAAALRQLVAAIGDEAFVAGLRAHVSDNAFGNATLSDLLAALGRASGRDLTAWAQAWLRSAQVNTLRAVTDVTPDGRWRSVVIEQSAPDSHPVLRPHRLRLGRYDLVDGRGVASPAVELEVSGARTEAAALVGAPAADLLLVNDGDLTFAKIRLDDRSAASLPSLLPLVGDPLARALLWSELMDRVRDAQAPLSALTSLMAQALPGERSLTIVDAVLETAMRFAGAYVSGVARSAALEDLRAVAAGLLATAEPGSPAQLTAARVAVAVATQPQPLWDWLAGDAPTGLALDADLCWRIRYRLAVLGAAGPATVDRWLAQERTGAAEQWAARCRAAIPTAGSKAAAWALVTADDSASNRIISATAEGFWQPEQAALTAEYVPRYFAELAEVIARRTPWVAETVARDLFPWPAVDRSTREATATLLASGTLPALALRKVIDADDQVRLALAARERWAASAAGGDQRPTMGE
ncbi:aminopeptidase N [Pilimelia columellifera]|uniref:Aminopeptidase N n=1 Tax=Pilimelia columellifera subsp. columellifera TaxID=706583 RepID=A0ABP6AZC3_9ACTN